MSATDSGRCVKDTLRMWRRSSSSNTRHRNYLSLVLGAGRRGLPIDVRCNGASFCCISDSLERPLALWGILFKVILALSEYHSLFCKNPCASSLLSRFKLSHSRDIELAPFFSTSTLDYIITSDTCA